MPNQFVSGYPAELFLLYFQDQSEIGTYYTQSLLKLTTQRQRVDAYLLKMDNKEPVSAVEFLIRYFYSSGSQPFEFQVPLLYLFLNFGPTNSLLHVLSASFDS